MKNNNMVFQNLYITQVQKKQIQMIAEKKQMKFSEIIRRAIDEYLEKQK